MGWRQSEFGLADVDFNAALPGFGFRWVESVRGQVRGRFVLGQFAAPRSDFSPIAVVFSERTRRIGLKVLRPDVKMFPEMKRNVTPKQSEEVIATLKARFEKNMGRHPGVAWEKVLARVAAMPDKLWSLAEMERTGGEPDVVGARAGEFVFMDCSAQSPAGRASLCYDREALDARKEHKPTSSVMDMAAEMGVDVLTEDQYFDLQKLGEFDTKRSSWLKTPPEIRELGGALFGDRRYGRVFIYHNGAESYYSGRGFRALLVV